MTVGSSSSDFAFNSERKCCTHLLWMRSASRSSSPCSSRMYCELTFLTSSTYVNLRRWNSPRWSRLCSFSSISPTSRSKNLTTPASQVFLSSTFARRTALFDWLSLRLAFRCCHALRLDNQKEPVRMLNFEKTTLYVLFFSGSQPCGKPSGINHFEFQLSVSTTKNFIHELRTRSKTMRHITAFRGEKEVSQARNSNLVHFVARELPFETCPNR